MMRNNPCHVQQPHRRLPTRVFVQPSGKASFAEQLAPNAGHVQKGGEGVICGVVSWSLAHVCVWLNQKGVSM